jgi:hypothetical protein
MWNAITDKRTSEQSKEYIKKIFIEKLKKYKEKINIEYLKNISIEKQVLLDETGYPLIKDNKIDETHLDIIYLIIYKIYEYLEDMNGSQLSYILGEIEMKFPQLNLEPIIKDEIFDNAEYGFVKRRTVTIGDNGNILRFIFDIEKIIKNYDIATVYILNVNNVSKLETGFRKHQLYHSSGSSRGIEGLKDKWLPYNGERGNYTISKPEDKFTYMCSKLLDVHNENMDKLNELLSNASNLLNYMRLINENYAISSYLLEKFKYEPLELNQEQQKFQQDEQKMEAFKIKCNITDSQSKFFYEKYLKYKTKYMKLKN